MRSAVLEGSEGALRVLLISSNRETVPAPVAPLGVSCIAGALRCAGHVVSILDLCFSRDANSDIRKAVGSFSPGLVGISIRNVDNLTFPGSISYIPEIADAVRSVEEATDAPIVLGGSGFSIFPELLMSFLGIRFGIVGEGEQAIVDLAHSLELGGGIPDLPNLLVQGRRTGVTTVPSPRFADTGLPARDLLDNRRYLEQGGSGNLQTKRGCSFSCSYCTYPQISGPALRLRPPEDVAAEMALLGREFGIDHVVFVDDIFNWPPSHAFSVCEAIASRGLKIGWTCFASPLGMTPELARMMKRAGCKGVEFGTDSGSGPMLASLGKPFVLEDVWSASAACRDAGLPDAHYIIFGGPGETVRTLSETFATFDGVRPRAVLALLGVRLYPNTALHRTALDEKVLDPDDDLLQPKFYVSDSVGVDTLRETVAKHAGDRPNWVVPGLGLRSDPAILSALRRRGHRGPLWDKL